MKQVFQDLSDGTTEVSEVPTPSCGAGSLLIRASHSLVSAGTERALVEFGKAGYLAKARQQPDKVRMVAEKIRTDGLLTTIDAVRSKLAQPIPLGYSSVGTVIEVGDGVEGFKVGDRVASNGNHAEIVCVPKNLCAKVPEGVSDEAACFTVLGSIGLQGIRLVEPTLGETVVVTGLGLIGLLTVQMLRANGCRVVGIDFDEEKLNLAESWGASVVRLSQDQDPVEVVSQLTGGVGADAVIITASTDSDEVISQAAQMSRKRGRIVLVGVIGLDLNRSDFFEKELTFQVSCSYGPGRYDSLYEQRGHDYPLPFVRWTENRNFQAVLELMDSGALEVAPLVSGSYPIAKAAEAYQRLLDDSAVLGMLIEYPDSAAATESGRIVQLADAQLRSAKGVIGAVGAGNYAGRVLLPAFRDAGAGLHTIVSSQGKSSHHVGRRLGFETNSTDLDSMLSDDAIDSVVIATRHGSHADLVVRALDAGKHVFVEKPLALSLEDLKRISEARARALQKGAGGGVMVGFNRRFAPLVKRMKEQLSRSKAPLSVVYTCNAGAIPAESWVHDPRSGGGRIVGEACHFVDMARFLVGSQILSHSIVTMRDPAGLLDTATISLGFEDGSIATVHYLANGSRSFPKERIEVFQSGKILVLDNFRVLSAFGSGGGKRTLRQDKGQAGCVSAFMASVRNGGEMPIPFGELFEVSRVMVELADASSGGGMD
jgi:predicted dehydrogenase/threonine dehydrogenase-like Zn-dependent dehydrogenase